MSKKESLTITYVAKHDSGGGQDENSITYALESLGHKVQRLRESRGQFAHRLACDFLLFHGWHDLESLADTKLRCPKVFWYFDLVDFPDPTLKSRCDIRKKWITEVTRLADLGFCTDGDWVEKDTTGKLHVLRQGCDIRVARAGKQSGIIPRLLLFTGISAGGGKGRIKFVNNMTTMYGRNFHHFSNGVYGRELANVIADTEIVVAPNSPISNNYWSNRVFTVLGFGGFLLHPYCEKLLDYYDEGTELIMYRDMEDLYSNIDFYLGSSINSTSTSNPSSISLREKIAYAGWARTVACHSYTNRCKELIEVVKEKLL